MKKTSGKISDSGKKVFVGIDVHKRSYSVVAVVEGMVVKKWRTLASPEKLAEQLKRPASWCLYRNCLRIRIFRVCTSQSSI